MSLSDSGTSPAAMRWRDALDDGGLADARLADQHRVVLGAPRQHLHRPANLLVAADHRVELAAARQLGQVAGVLRQRLVLPLGVRIGDPLAAADLGQRLQQRRPCGRPASFRARLAAPWSLAISASSRCSLEMYSSLNSCDCRSASSIRSLQPPADVDLGGGAATWGCSSSRLERRLAYQPRVDAQLAQQRARDTLLLVEQRQQQVLGRQLLVVALLRQLLRRAQGLLGLDGQLVEPHLEGFSKHHQPRDKRTAPL